MQRNTRNFSPAPAAPKAPGKPEAPQSVQSVPQVGNALTPGAPAPQAVAALLPQSSLGRAISHLGGK